MKKYVMAFDSGTTSNRCILFNKKGEICSVAQKEFTQYFPKPGWVEHDAEEIWSTQMEVAEAAMANIHAAAADIAAIGITNQRETTIVWDKNTGEPLCHAIVWQCRRTSEYCDVLKRADRENPSEDRDCHRRKFFRHKDKMDTGQCGGCQRAGAARRNPLRHRGDMADLEADKRQSACDRLLQCLTDHAF